MDITALQLVSFLGGRGVSHPDNKSFIFILLLSVTPQMFKSIRPLDNLAPKPVNFAVRIALGRFNSPPRVCIH